MKYTLIKHLGTIGNRHGRVIEANIMIWDVGDRKPYVDIRPWSGDHTMMGKGIRLTYDEAEALSKILREVKI